ncbi:MAG TPA: SRPBCC family protein [Nocardioidaceae bacterium]|nr:SRPBCC family protein [Nocardioidaceae bacterium]
MQLEHRFTVPASIDVAWEALMDLESVGSCFPGATVTSVEGDEFAGTCKIKLGPISMQYSGSGKFVERDESSRRAVIEAKGKDKRGNGTAAVTVTASLTAESEERTAVAVDTDLNITGKPAQFGRGVIQDVSDKLLGQFTECLESKIGAADDQGTAAESAPASVPESESAAASTAPPTAASREPEPEPRAAQRSEQSDSSALDLGATVLPVLAKRYAPYAVGALVVLFVLWRILRR